MILLYVSTKAPSGMVTCNEVAPGGTDEELLADAESLLARGQGLNGSIVLHPLFGCYYTFGPDPQGQSAPEARLLAKLKEDWARDPCWDIEDTEGYEAYREELTLFANAKRAEWEEQARLAEANLVAQMGLEDNLKLAHYLMRQQTTIDTLRKQLARLEDRQDTHESEGHG